MPAAPVTSLESIASALNIFFSRGKIAKVHFAENATVPPPALAYLVHFPRLSLTLSGHDSLWVERSGRSRTLTLARGEVLVVPANCWSRPLWTQPATTLNLLFGRQQIGLSLVRHHGEKPVPPKATKAAIQGTLAEAPQNMMQALLALNGKAEQAALPLVEALLRTVLATARSPAAEPRRRALSLYQEICMYVQEHLQAEISRDTVATHFRVSPNHVSRLFKNEGLVSFNDYVNYVRINRAKYLLKNHRQALDEIAAACGFAEASYFCRVFKKITKSTPSHYRQSSLSRISERITPHSDPPS